MITAVTANSYRTSSVLGTVLSTSQVSIHIILKTILPWVTMIIPILQMRKLRHGEFMKVYQCYRANQWRKEFIFRGSGSRVQSHNGCAKLPLIIQHNNSWIELKILLRSWILLSHTENGSASKTEKSHLNSRITKKLHTYTHIHIHMCTHARARAHTHTHTLVYGDYVTATVSLKLLMFPDEI